MSILAGSDDGPQSFEPFLRITVLGLRDSGKTSLISSWVNNFCPLVYVPTEEPALYYNTVKIVNPLEDAEEPISALVEIEDADQQSQRGEKDVHGHKIQINLLDLTQPEPRTGEPKLPKGPLADHHAPTGRHQPISRCRMGFLLVFDSSSEDSFQGAKKLYELMEKEDPHAILSTLPLYLVANKIDKAPVEETTVKTMKAARIWAETKKIKYAEVSAMKFVKVRKLFRELVEEISTQPNLWLSDAEKEYWDKKQRTMAGRDGTCSLQ